MSEADWSSVLLPFKAKLDRANESLHTLNEEYRRFPHEHPLRTDVKVGFSDWLEHRIIAEAEPIPIEFGVLVGEALYHP